MSGQNFTVRRRYQQADYRPAPHGGWHIYLDERLLKTPAGFTALVPTEALGIALVAEWQAQTNDIRPNTMPLNQLLMTAHDRIKPNHQLICAELLNYLSTELICHYGTDERLIAYQRQHWQPLHHWLAENFLLVLPITFGVQPIRTPVDATRLQRRLDAYDAYHLSALSAAVAASGSFVIGLALAERAIGAAAALLAAEAESDWQATLWGEDEATAKRRATIHADLQAVETFVSLLVD